MTSKFESLNKTTLEGISDVYKKMKAPNQALKNYFRNFSALTANVSR